MQVRKLVVPGVVAFASWSAIGLATPAYALCESYSGGCPTATPSTPPGTGTGGGGGTGGSGQQPGPGNSGGQPGQPGQPGKPGTVVPNGQTPIQGSVTRPGADAGPSTLPFTGGELVLLTALGAGAVAGGTALVVAGRRRKGDLAG
jgi:hypothetical protein